MKNILSKIQKAPLIRIFSIISILSVVLWITLLIIQKTSIYQSFVFFNGVNPGHDLFMDFINPIKYAQDNMPFESLDLGEKSWRCYTPFTFFIFNILGIISRNINSFVDNNINILLFSLIMSFMSFGITAIIYSNFKGIKNIDKFLFLTAFFCSGVYMFAFERANIILFALLLSLFFICYHDAQNKILKELALISLALAFAIKIYPAIFGLLLIYKRDYKSAFRAFTYGILLFVLPALYYPRGLETLVTMKESLSLLTSRIIYKANIYNAPTGKSLLIHFLPHSLYYEITTKLSIITNYIMITLCSLSVFLSFFFQNRWKQILAMVLCIILIPTVSMHYIILYFLPVMIIFFQEETQKKSTYLYCLFFFVLFTPIQIVTITNTNEVLYYVFAVQNIIIVIMLIDTIIYGVKCFKENDGFIKIKQELVNIIQIFKLNKLKYTLLPLLSIIILIIGHFIYSKNYEIYNANNNQITEAKELILKNDPIILSDDYSIRMVLIINPSKNKDSKVLLKTADNTDGINITYFDNKIYAILNGNDNKAEAIVFPNIIPDNVYKFELQITNKTVSVFMQLFENNQYKSLNNILKKFELNKHAIQYIKLYSQSSGLILPFDCKIRNGKSTNLLVTIILLLALLPLFIMVHSKNRNENQ